MAKLKILTFFLIIMLSSATLALTTISIDSPKDKSRTEDIKVFLRGRVEGANDLSINKAKVLLEKGLLRPSVNRSYYAMFYAVLALLTVKRRETSKHRLNGGVGPGQLTGGSDPMPLT